MKRRTTKSAPFWADGRPMRRKDKLRIRQSAERGMKAIFDELSKPPLQFAMQKPVRTTGGLYAFLREKHHD